MAGWRDREYVGRPGLSPFVAGLVAGGVVSPGLDLLDVGCGRGADALPLAALGVRVTGIDVNARSIAHAKRRAREADLRVDLRVHDVTEGLPFPRASFDVVVDTLLYNNLDEDALDAYADELARVLRRGGHLVLQHKIGPRPATWHPTRAPPELDARFEFGLPVHTHLAERGGRVTPVIAMVGKKRLRSRTSP